MVEEVKDPYYLFRISTLPSPEQLLQHRQIVENAMQLIEKRATLIQQEQ